MPVFCFLKEGINLVEQALKFLQIEFAFMRDIDCHTKFKEGELVETTISKVQKCTILNAWSFQ